MRGTLRAMLAGLGILAASCGAWAADGTVVLLSLNDIHSHLFPYEVVEGSGAAKRTLSVGGLARAATLIRQEREASGGEVLVAFPGDLGEGPLFFFLKGEAEVRGLNLIGTDAATLGNHEFDLGDEGMRQALAWARYPVLVSNLTPLSGRAPFLPYKILTTPKGLRVGFFGFVPAELASVTKGSRDYRVEEDLRGAARRMVAKLRSEGCDLIVLLSHAGIYADRDLAASVEGIHAILGGHTHTLLEKGELVEGPKGWMTLIGQAGAMCRWLGRMVVVVRDGRLDPERSGWSVRELTADVPADPRVELFLEPYRSRLDRELNVPVGTLPEPADATKAVVRARESGLGDLIAEAFRWKADAQIGLINGGSIRGDQVYPAGPLSYRTLYEMMPYGNTLIRGTLTGAELRQVLELSASALAFPGDGYDAAKRTPTGGFLQVAGLRFVLDPHRRPALVDNRGNISFPGDRVSEIRVETSPGVWKALSEGDRYTLVVNDWIGTGGDKYVFLGQILKERGRNLQLGDVDSLAEYVRAAEVLRLAPDGRIRIRE